MRFRRAAAATAASRCLSICLLGRPTGFLGRPGPKGPRAAEQGPPPPLPPLLEFSDGPEGLPSPRPDDEEEDEDEELLAEELV